MGPARPPRRRGQRLAALLLVAALTMGFAPATTVGDLLRSNRADTAAGMPSTDEIFQWVEEITELGYRRTGTASGRRAAAYMKREFERIGLQDVHYETASSWDWRARRWGLQVEGDAFDSYPSAHSFITPGEPSRFSTGPGGRTAEIVDIGLGTPVDQVLQDVEGKIVVFDLKFLLPLAGLAPSMEFLWDPALSLATPPDTMLTANPYITTISTVLQEAMDRGAVGFVGVLSDYWESNRYHNEFYRRLPVTIPGLWVTADEGAAIRRAMQASDGAPTATITLEGRRRRATGRTVVGVLPGQTTDTIQVQSHHDSVWDGAVEDASGSAEVLALAEYFANQPLESRTKTLMFTTFDTHFTGYQSHQQFVEKYVHGSETPYDLVANVTVEHIGRHAVRRDGDLVVRDEVEPRGIINNVSLPLKASIIDAVTRYDLRRTAMLSGDVISTAAVAFGGEGIPTDASFAFVAGVPTVSLISGPMYLYDQADTLDKVAVEELRPVARAFADIIHDIDATPRDEIAGPLS